MAKRNWVWTLFVPEHGDFADFLSVGDGLKFAVWQLESCPDTGRLHLQGYAELESPMRLAAFKRRLGDDRAHVEERRGSSAQAIAYCEKPESRVAGPWRVCRCPFTCPFLTSH